MTQAFLEKEDCNVIAFDWSAYADSKSYALVTVTINPVGEALGDFIRKMFGKLLTRVHVIGHSLGAHVAGAAGTYTYTTLCSEDLAKARVHG